MLFFFSEHEVHLSHHHILLSSSSYVKKNRQFVVVVGIAEVAKKRRRRRRSFFFEKQQAAGLVRSTIVLRSTFLLYRRARAQRLIENCTTGRSTTTGEQSKKDTSHLLLLHIDCKRFREEGEKNVDLRYVPSYGDTKKKKKGEETEKYIIFIIGTFLKDE